MDQKILKEMEKDMNVKEKIKDIGIKYNKKEKVILIMLVQCQKLGYNIRVSIEIIKDFLEKDTCPKLVHIKQESIELNRRT